MKEIMTTEGDREDGATRIEELSRKPVTPELLKAIKASGLSISLGGTEILHDVGMEVPQGDVLCIIGPNGAGKSTLLKCIAGTYRRHSGTITIEGRATKELRPRELARIVACVPQSSPSDMPYTVGEFLDMSRYPWRRISSAAEDRHIVAEAAKLIGVEALTERKLSTLSGGERQKVMIAAALAQDTKIILLDEPTTYLDYAHQVDIVEAMSRINRDRDVTIVAVTHDVNLAMQISGSILALRDGKVAWNGPPIELLEPGRLRNIYGVTFERYFSRDGNPHPLLAPASRI